MPMKFQLRLWIGLEYFSWADGIEQSNELRNVTRLPLPVVKSAGHLAPAPGFVLSVVR